MPRNKKRDRNRKLPKELTAAKPAGPAEEEVGQPAAGQPAIGQPTPAPEETATAGPAESAPAAPVLSDIQAPAAEPASAAPEQTEVPAPATVGFAGKLRATGTGGAAKLRAAGDAVARRLPGRAAVQAGLRTFGRGVWMRGTRQNPVLMRALAICSVLAVATTLKNGLLLAVAAIAVTVPLALVMALLRCTPLERKLPAFIWPAVTLTLAGALTMPTCWLSYWAAPNVTTAVGIFLPLTALNATLLVESGAAARRRSPLAALTAACGDSLGFAAVVIAVAALREIFGKGTLYARPVFGQMRFGFLLTPAGAFLLLGCLLAAAQWRRQRRAAPRKGGEGK